MVHTLTINHRILNNRVLDEIYKRLEEITGVKPRKIDSGVFATEALKEKGYTFIKLISKRIDSKYKHNYMMIELTINPSKILGVNKLEVLKEVQIEELIQRFNTDTKHIQEQLPRLEHWTTKRIDYAVNINTPYVKEYIKLFRRGDRPKGFKEYTRDKGNDLEEKGGLYLFNGSITINFYDKESERLWNNFNKDGAKNLLRFEIQCKPSKTNTMKSKYDFDSKHLVNYLNDDISCQQIQYYYEKVIGQGDYYMLSEAVNRVNKSDYTSATKDKLITVLKDINTHRSIWKAREESKYNKNCFNRYLKQIRELGVNPVTIPSRWKMKCLNNIYNKV